MTLTTAEKWKIGGAVTLVILICAGLAVHSLLAAHDATLKASAASQVRAEVEKQADASIATRDAQLKQVQQQLDAAKAAVKTPQQAAQVIDHYVQVSTPAQSVVVQKSALSVATQQELPDAPAYVVQTDLKAEATAKTLIDCQSTAATASTCAADLADTRTKLQAVTADRDDWKTAAHGGSFWTRLKSGAKWAGIGALAGAAAGYAAHK